MSETEAESTSARSERVDEWQGCKGRIDGGSSPFWMALSTLHFFTPTEAATSDLGRPSASRMRHFSITSGVITTDPQTADGA